MSNVVANIALVMLAVVLAGIGFVYSGIYYVGADRPHWSATTWLLNQARDRSIRAHGSGVAVPAGLDDGVRIVAGIAHFNEHCVVCHGAPGVERGDIANGLYPRPPNLADAARHYTPRELFWIVKHGIKMSGMPAWGDHGDDELWATVAFLQQLVEMSPQDYAKLVAASRAQGGHRHESQEQEQPQPAPMQAPTGKDHDHPAGHHH
jgi:mono/diheme cytochrome c family protein